MDRCEEIVTEEEDRKKEEQHVIEALGKCGYPEWTFRRVKNQKATKHQRDMEKIKKRKEGERSRGQVILPYVKGVTEGISRILNIGCPQLSNLNRQSGICLYTLKTKWINWIRVK